MATATPTVFHLSLVVGGELRDAAGERLGRVDDLIVRLGDEDYPPVTGVVATVAGRPVFVAAEQIVEIAPGFVTLIAQQLDLQHFRRRPQEVLLKKDVLDRQLINVDGARLVRANEIELARLDGWYRVVGVDVSLRSLVRRVLPRALAGRVEPRSFLDWASVEPFTGHVPTVRLRVPHPKLAKLHPAQLADLVEAASHNEGEEIMAAVAADPELEADVFEELEDSHQREFVEDRSDERDRRAARADGERRRRRSRAAASRGAARARDRAPLPVPGAPPPHAARLRPRDGRRADEPGVRVRLRRRDARGGARPGRAVDAPAGVALLGVRHEHAPAPARRDRPRRPPARGRGRAALERPAAGADGARPTPTSRRSRG